MLMHASVNNTIGIVPLAASSAADSFAFGAPVIGWIAVGLSWVIAISLLFQMRRADIGP